jgi:hypothetical protein
MNRHNIAVAISAQGSNTMGNDPRWQQALRLLREATAAYERGDSQTMARSFERYCATLDSLALDPAVVRVERRRAAKLLEKISAQLAAGLPALLHRLAEIRDTAPDTAARAEAAALLADATERLPAASNAIQ